MPFRIASQNVDENPPTIFLEAHQFNRASPELGWIMCVLHLTLRFPLYVWRLSLNAQRRAASLWKRSGLRRIRFLRFHRLNDRVGELRGSGCAAHVAS